VNPAADRLDRTARLLRELEVSDRTAGIVELLAMGISMTVTTSPDDAADFIELVARQMRG
jgi:hypothetical protein